MSLAAAHAQKFYEQVVREGKVYTFEETDEFLVFPVGEIEIVPFWSSRNRLLIIQKNHPKYRNYQIAELSFNEFYNQTLPLLEKETIRVGINWSGHRLQGYDSSVDDLRKCLDYWR